MENNWGKEFCDVEQVWLVGSLEGDMFTTRFVFDTEDMADLMLFCLERAMN